MSIVLLICSPSCVNAATCRKSLKNIGFFLIFELASSHQTNSFKAKILGNDDNIFCMLVFNLIRLDYQPLFQK